jgi:hypothetical protein
MEVSDHTPCVVNISTNIPKGKKIRFENYWMEHEVFMDVVRHGWNLPTFQTDKAKVISTKFKNLRRVLKAWQAQLSSLKDNIENVKLVLWLFHLFELHRDLTIVEWNFKHILEDKLDQVVEWNFKHILELHRDLTIVEWKLTKLSKIYLLTNHQGQMVSIQISSKRHGQLSSMIFMSFV